LAFIQTNKNHAKGRAHRLGIFEYFPYALRRSVGRDVVILRLEIEQKVAYAPAGEICNMPRSAELLHHGDGIFAPALRA
jgi:hypothetical protein